MMVKADWKSVSMKPGEQSVTTAGLLLMLKLPADPWAILETVSSLATVV